MNTRYEFLCMYVCETACGCVVHRAVCVVCSVSVVPVCLLLVYGVLHEVSPHWHLPARLPQGRDLGSLLVADSGHTLTQPLCAQDRDPEPLALPWRVSRWCQPLPRRPLRQRFLAATHVQHLCPKWRWRSYPRGLYSFPPGGPQHPFGLYSIETRDSQKHPGITIPCTSTSPMKVSDESIIQPGGRKRPCLINT